MADALASNGSVVAPLSVGDTVAARYRVRERVGRVAGCELYRVEHVHMRKLYALELYPPASEGAVEAERRAVAASAVEHPSMVLAADMGTLPDGSFYLVRDHFEGRRLDEVLAAGVPDKVRALEILRQVSDALAAAHRVGVVHGSLSLERILIVERPEGRVLVKVVGLAGLGDVAVGSSPELVGADVYADIRGLGAIALALFTGSRDTQAVARAEAIPTFLSNAVEPALAQLIHGALRAHSAMAPSCASIVTACEKLLRRASRRTMMSGELGSTHSAVERPREPLRELRRWVRRNPLPSVGIGAGVLLLLVTIVLVSLHKSATGPGVAAQATAPSAVTEPTATEPALPGLGPRSREQTLAFAALGHEQSLAAARRMAEEQHDAEAWLAYGRGLGRRGRYMEAVDAYDKGLALNPKLSSDSGLVRDVRRAIDDDRAAEQALRVAARRMGSVGVDLLYDKWVSTSDKTPTTQLARQLAYESEVRRQASPSLEAVLALREAKDCEETARKLPDLVLHGDQRAVRILQPMLSPLGCGPGKKEDCFPCLRQDTELLQAAYDSAKQRPGPRLIY